MLMFFNNIDVVSSHNILLVKSFVYAYGYLTIGMHTHTHTYTAEAESESCV